jgi:GntR family transcriptional regulator / MocR family aminotransferase
VRAEIPSGRLPVRARLPSARAMAAGLGVSRTTVVAAFDQLLAEGYP